MANDRGELSLKLQLGGVAIPSSTRYWWSAGGAVLTISTVIPDPGLAFEQVSSYLGHPDTDTTVGRLTVTRGHPAQIESHTRPGAEINTLDGTRSCAYEHLHHLVDTLNERGYAIQVDIAEGAFAALESVE